MKRLLRQALAAGGGFAREFYLMQPKADAIPARDRRRLIDPVPSGSDARAALHDDRMEAESTAWDAEQRRAHEASGCQCDRVPDDYWPRVRAHIANRPRLVEASGPDPAPLF